MKACTKSYVALITLGLVVGIVPPTLRAQERDDPGMRRQWMGERFPEAGSRAEAQRLLREAQKVRAVRAAIVASQHGSQPTWSSIGPTGDDSIHNGVTLDVVDSGRVRTILPDLSDPTGNTIYLLTAGGGLWKTTNFLSSPPDWKPMTDDLVSTSGGSVAFGRTTNVLYLGLGDPFDFAPQVGGTMVVSNDAGVHWSEPVLLPGAQSVRDVKVDVRGGADVVLVATAGGIFRSPDAGRTYSPVLHQDTWSIVRTSAGWLAAAWVYDNASGSPLYLSTDRGATWVPIESAAFANAGRTTLAVGEPGDPVVYAFAATRDGWGQDDLFRSSDGGLTWTPLHITEASPRNPNWDQRNMDLMSYQAWYNQLIVVDPADPTRNTVYLGGELATAKSMDGGVTWWILSDWLPGGSWTWDTSSLPYVHADCHAAATSDGNGGHQIIFGTDGGIFVSSNSGWKWDSTKNIGLVTTLHYSIESNPAIDGNVLTGLQDLGTRVRKGRTSFFEQVIGGDGFGVGASQATGAVSLATVNAYWAPVWADTYPMPDQYWSWYPTSCCTIPSYYAFYIPIASPSATSDPTGRVFFTRTVDPDVIYESTDGASSWHAIGQVGIELLPEVSLLTGLSRLSMSVRPIGVSPEDTKHVGVGASGPRGEGALALTTDDGVTWTTVSVSDQVPGFASWGSVDSVAWASNRVIYVSSESGYGPDHVARSDNGGRTWVSAARGLPDAPVSRLVVDPRDRTGNTVFAATFFGVYRTVDRGASWQPYGVGMPSVWVTDLYLTPDGKTLRAATYGRGIWEIEVGP